MPTAQAAPPEAVSHRVRVGSPIAIAAAPATTQANCAQAGAGGDSGVDVARENAFLVRGRLLLEDLPRRHADHAGLHAVGA